MINFPILFCKEAWSYLPYTVFLKDVLSPEMPSSLLVFKKLLWFGTTPARYASSILTVRSA
jgi:hypothetical protein